MRYFQVGREHKVKGQPFQPYKISLGNLLTHTSISSVANHIADNFFREFVRVTVFDQNFPTNYLYHLMVIRFMRKTDDSSGQISSHFFLNVHMGCIEKIGITP